MPQYETPEVVVLGSITELTQAKPGIYFDGIGAQQGSDTPPPPGTPGTS